MATTRATLLTQLEYRLDDVSNAIWSEAELKSFIDAAVTSLYPTFFNRNVTTTTPVADGPIATKPSGAKNLYFVGIQRAGSTRVRKIRGWTEGDTTAHIPKTDITGLTLVWAWTSGWETPASDGASITIPDTAIEVCLLRAQVSALEQLLTQRVQSQKYHALQVRASISEEDIISTLEALHASIRERIQEQQSALPLPEVQNV